MNIDPARLNTSSLLTFEKVAPHQTTADFLLNIIPSSALDAFAKSDMLQVLLFSVLFGIGLSIIGGIGRPVLDFIDRVSHVLFAIVGVLMRLVPLGTFGAMAFAVAKFGLNSLWPLASLMLVIYGSSAVFIVVVLGGICLLSGFSLWKYLFYLKEEIFIVLATTSSEAALPTLIRKLEHAGCAEQVVGLVIPTGYSFNLDRTCLCQVICAMFIAQAMGIHLDLVNQITPMGVSMLTSKGSVGVAGVSFIALLSTLSAFKQIPIEGGAIILGVDRFISEIRSVTNMIGNGIATLALAKWEGEQDDVRMHAALNQTSLLPDESEVMAAAALSPAQHVR